MKYLGRLALLFLLAVKAYATITVTIDVSGITGGNLPGSSIVITLQHCATARVVGTGQVVPQSQTVYPHFGASTITLFDNTQISCSGQIVSYYSFSFIYQGVTTQIGSYNLPPGIYQLANLTPCTGTGCYGPAPPATPVTQIIAGSNITITPTTGVGAVTVNSTGGFINPMTTAGDLITGGTAGAAQRVGIGSSGQVLSVVSGAPAWAAATGGSSVGGVGTFQEAGSTAGSFRASSLVRSGGIIGTPEALVAGTLTAIPLGFASFISSAGDTGVGSGGLIIQESSSNAADAKIWDSFITTNTLHFRAVNDAYNAANDWLDVTRSGASITAVTFPTITDSALTPGTTPICPNGSGGAFTTAGCAVVSSVSVVSANGVSGTSSGGTTPALTIALGAITPTSIVSSGPITAGGAIPSIATGTASNTDLTGQVTLSAGAGTQALTGTYTSAPIVTCSDTTAVAAVKCVASTTTITITGTGTDVINYITIKRN